MTNQKQYYVYLHSVADRGVFYIGKGDEKRTKKIFRKHNPHHTNVLLKYGVDNVVVTAIPCMSEQHALDLEVMLIESYRNAGAKLTNLTDGGEGASGYKHTDEALVKISIAALSKSPTAMKEISAMAKKMLARELIASNKVDIKPSIEEIKDMVIRIIISNGQDGISPGSIVRYCRRYRELSKSEQKEVIDQILEKGEIKIIKEKQQSGQVKQRLVAI